MSDAVSGFDGGGVREEGAEAHCYGSGCGEWEGL